MYDDDHPFFSDDDDAFFRGFLEDALPKISQSHIGMAWVDRDLEGIDAVDVKQAVQLGAMLLLDKPLVLVVERGCTLGVRLRRAADLVIEDIDPDDPADRRRLTEALGDFAKELDRAESEHHRQPGE